MARGRVFFKCAGGDELPVPGDEFDGPFGEFGPFRGVFPCGFPGDPDDQPRQQHPGDEQAARERDGGRRDAVAMTATAAVPTSPATPAGSSHRRTASCRASTSDTSRVTRSPPEYREPGTRAW